MCKIICMKLLTQTFLIWVKSDQNTKNRYKNKSAFNTLSSRERKKDNILNSVVKTICVQMHNSRKFMCLVLNICNNFTHNFLICL